MRGRHLACALTAAAYVGAAFFATPKLRHAWWYLQENATRRFSTFVALTAANAFFPWCYAYEAETLRNLAARGGKSPWSPDLLPRLPFAEGGEYVNARMMTMGRFKGILEDYAARHGGYRLWCVGRWDFWLTPRRRAEKDAADDSAVKGNVTLNAFLRCFAGETNFTAFAEARIYSPADLLAAYMGDEREIAPAFAAYAAQGAWRGRLAGIRTAFRPVPTGGGQAVRPGLFCPADGADMRWVKKGGADRTVFETFAKDVLARQRARREILKGFDLADAGKTEAALTTWAGAAAVNPRDPILVVLGEAMNREAQAYLDFGNAGAALRCWENRLVVFPDDYATLYNVAACFTRLGDTARAMRILQCAKALQDERNRKSRGSSK